MARLVMPEGGSTGTEGTEPAGVRPFPLSGRQVVGTLFANRFRVRGPLGSGASGHVFVAEDTATGKDVALKVFAGSGLAERFSREGALLATLSHPAIVTYVDHGVSAAGERYVATARLHGQTLKQRLRQGPLSQADAARVGMRVASALATAHANGIIHRDIKPENLMVVDDDLDQVTVLDFGIARHVDLLRVTGTGHWVGTPMYMAPEQARGEAHLDGRADLFSLGCVLLECLLAKPLFVGDSALATLAKICFDDHVPLAQLCPDVDPGLQDVIAGLLAKDREHRTSNAQLLMQQLEGVLPGLPAHAEAPPRQRQPSSIGLGERRVHALLLISPAVDGGDQGPLTAQVSETLERVAPWTQRAQTLLGGTVLVTVPGDSPMDQAVNAGRCALALRPVCGDRRFALGLGRKFNDAGNRDLADITTELLSATGAGEIRIDETVAALLEARFEVASKTTEEGKVFTLQAERNSLEPPRTVLGKVLPCVGRQRELANLQAIFAECMAEPGARAVLVTAPAGGGKSRVRFELMQALQAQHPKLQFLIARGDPLRSNAPLGVVSALLRSKAQIHGGEDLQAQQALVVKHIGKHIRELGSDPQHKRRTIAFLGEMMGVAFSDEGLLALQTARRDPHVMGDQTKLAWLEFVNGVSADEPLVLVVEDLHWGDGPSVQALDDAMRMYRDRPVFVAAFARPEVETRFPKLWAERAVEYVTLRPLPVAALEQLVKEALPDVSAAVTARLAEHCDGNPFFLEELLRAHEGRARRTGADTEESAPSSVLGVIQARFDGLGEDAKRVLRAASVFGERFTIEGITALLNQALPASIGSSLRVLSEKEIIYAEGLKTEGQLAFRHALFRDAAYDTLTEDDRKDGHLGAALWLEQQPQPSAIVLVEHFERAQRADRTAHWCCRAAEDALVAADIATTLQIAQRGIACRPDDSTMGLLRLFQADALAWSGRNAEAEPAFRESLSLLEPENRSRAYLPFVHCLGNLGKPKEAAEFALQACKASRGSEQASRVQCSLAAAAVHLLIIGDSAIQLRMLAARRTDVGDLAAAHWMSFEAALAMHSGSPSAALAKAKEAIALFERVGDVKYKMAQIQNASSFLLDLGAFEEAWGNPNPQRLDLECFTEIVDANHSQILLRSGRLWEALEIAEKARVRSSHLPLNLSFALAILAQANLGLGRKGPADTASAEALTQGRQFESYLPLLAAVRAKVLLALRNSLEALAVCQEAINVIEQGRPVRDGEMLARSTYVDCLLAVDRRIDAIAAARDNAQRLAHLTTKITECKYQLTYLHNIPENRDVVRQARELGIDLNPPELSVLLS